MAFQIIPYLVILAASSLLSYALRPKTKEEKPDAGKIELPTAEEGEPVSVIFGTVWLKNPHIVWWGDRYVDYEGNDKKGRHYEYHIGAHLILCNEADSINKIYFGEKELWSGNITSDDQITVEKGGLFGGDNRDGGFVGDIDIMFGRASGAANTYLAAEISTTPQPRFYGVVGLVLRRPNVGNSPLLKPISVMAWRSYDDWYAGKAVIDRINSDLNDVNPAHIIYECLTNSIWGMGYSTGSIDSTSFEAAADQLYTEGFGISIEYDGTGSIEDFIQEITDHIHAVVYENPTNGKVELHLIRKDYSIESLPVINESNARLISYARTGWGERVCEVKVTYTDIDRLSIPATSAPAHDYGVFDMQGAMVSQTTNYRGCSRIDLANYIAARDLRIQSSPVAKATLRVNRFAWNLFVGGVFRLQWSGIGGGTIDAAMRVIEIDYGSPTNPEIEIQSAEDVFAFGDSFAAEQPPIESPSDEALPVVDQFLIDMPYWELRRRRADIESLSTSTAIAMYGAAQPDGIVYEYDLYVDSGGGYIEGDTNCQWTPYAELSASVTLTGTSLSITAGNRISSVSTGTLIAIDTEMMRVTAVSESSLTVERAAIDTVLHTHASGAAIWFWDGFNFSNEIVYLDGQEVDAKAVTRSVSGDLAIGDATAINKTLAARPRLPYNVKKLAFQGEYFPTTPLTEEEDLEITWSNTDRLTQIVSAPVFLSDSVTIQSGAQVEIEISITGGAVLRTVNTTGTSYTYTTTMERDDEYGEGMWDTENPPLLHESLDIRIVVVLGADESYQEWLWTMTRDLPPPVLEWTSGTSSNTRTLRGATAITI